jgi:hypothetical protein
MPPKQLELPRRPHSHQHFNRRMTMQKSLYEAIFELQEKKPSLTTISALKRLLLELNLNFEVEISSSRVWICKLDLLKDRFSGVIDLEIWPRVVWKKGTSFDATQCHRHPNKFSFHFEGTNISKEFLKKNFLNILLDDIVNLEKNC